MNEQSLTQQEIKDQLSDMSEIAEQNKVELTPDVKEYMHQCMQVILRKLEKGMEIEKRDISFLHNIKAWIKIPEKFRVQFPDLSEMLNSEKISIQDRECISLTQWEDLQKLANEQSTDPLKWIEEKVVFEKGRIIVNDRIHLFVSEIKKLPDGLYAKQGLGIDKCTLSKLPEDLKVDGVLFLDDCYVTEIPNSLDLNGSLLIMGTPINKLPEFIKVFEKLHISSNSSIKEIPEGITINKNLYICDSKINRMPNNIIIKGDFDATDGELEELPKGFKVGGSLILRRSKVINLPEELEIGGDLIIDQTDITEIPGSIKLKGGLQAEHSKLKTLPENFTVNGDLSLRSTPMSELPTNLAVNGGNINFSHTHISSLPDGFKFSGKLDLSFTKIQKLPSDLKLIELNIRNTKITDLPEDIQVETIMFDMEDPILVSQVNKLKQEHKINSIKLQY